MKSKTSCTVTPPNWLKFARQQGTVDVGPPHTRPAPLKETFRPVQADACTVEHVEPRQHAPTGSLIEHAPVNPPLKFSANDRIACIDRRGVCVFAFAP